MFSVAFSEASKWSFLTDNSDPESFYTNMGFVVDRLVDQGLNFYEPFEVAGYPAYHQIPGYNRNWITTYALAYRYQTGDLLIEPPGGANPLSIIPGCGRVGGGIQEM